jgi:hypothetical protein
MIPNPRTALYTQEVLHPDASRIVQRESRITFACRNRVLCLSKYCKSNTTWPTILLSKQLVQNPSKEARLRLLDEVAMILFNLRKIRNEIDLMGFEELGLLQELPSNKQYGEHADLHRHVSVINHGLSYGKLTMRYENKKFGTFHMPFRKTVYPPTKVIMNVQISPYHAAYGWNLPLYGSVLRSSPCASHAL